MKKFTMLLSAIVLLAGIALYGINMPNDGIKDIDRTEYPMEVHYIDVGQADSALVICGGQAMLIDGGNTDDSRLIASYLKNEGIKSLEYVVCSHAHEDHVGGLSAALSTVNVSRVFAPKTGADTKAYKNFIKKTKEQGCTAETPSAGETVPLDTGTVEFLGPISEKGKDLNSTSIVLKITYGNTSFLFTGDAERDEEQEILDSGADLKATVLKAGHHGSSTSTTYPFLRAVMPQYAVISCEKGNSYGHPHRETLSKLSDAGTEVLRTDKNGTIIMLSDGERVVPLTEK